ncbi:unnamed protein product [Symbiodinium natans]|uniref:ABM domain-containing protein n=1 Tax=Symbiodinium natans TaxID=878477 RepID=A0A812R1Z2_9DINO|nr:unnamed protein product [Symbiodinium natans]
MKVPRDVLLLAAGALAAFGVLSAGTWTHRQLSQSPKVGWALIVQLRFKDISVRDEFLSFWTVLARYVRDNEPFTTLFQAIQSDKDPLLVIVDERYTSKDLYTGAHRSSAAFAEFRPKMKKLQDEGQLEVTGESGFAIDLA